MNEPVADTARGQRWIYAVLLAAAAATTVPFVPWIVLSLWLGLYAQRIHKPLAKKLGGRSGLAASLTVSLLLVIALPIAAVVTSIVLDLIVLVRQLWASDQAQAVLVQLVQGGGGSGSGTDTAADTKGALESGQSAIHLLMQQGDRAWAIARQVAGAAAHVVIGLLIMVTGMYGVLVSGRDWYAWFEEHGPIAPAQLARYGAAFMETGRGLWFGIVGAGLAQSIVATIAYLILGVPSALALGLLTLLFSVIPAIGTALVWVPLAAGLALTGRTGAAITLAVIGVAVIGSVDNLARPYLARRGKLQLSTWIVLFSMFGGIELIGGWGILLGPLALRMAKEALLIRSEATATARVPAIGAAGGGAAGGGAAGGAGDGAAGGAGGSNGP
jgi:predicted PurR-regulated permease PerM